MVPWKLTERLTTCTIESKLQFITTVRYSQSPKSLPSHTQELHRISRVREHFGLSSSRPACYSSYSSIAPQSGIIRPMEVGSSKLNRVECQYPHPGVLPLFTLR